VKSGPRALGLALLAVSCIGGAAQAKPKPAAKPDAPLATAPATAALTPDAAYHAPRGAADCIWAAVPQDVRDTIGSAQTVDAVAGAIKKLGADTTSQLALAHHCDVPENGADPADIVQHAVEAKTMEIWTTGQLKAAYGLDDARLAHAWTLVTADDKADFAHWFAAGFNAPDAKLDRVQVLMDGLGLSGEDAASLVAYYAGARATFEQLGGTD
jgi:hypothetical protein